MKKMIPETENDAAIEKMHAKSVIRRAVLAVISLVVLIAAVVYLTLGWYTKMTGITTTEFNVARWDFSANYQIDSFSVNVYEYDSPDGHNIAAPGTAGTFELRLGADDSDSDVHYLVQIDKSTMSEEFQKRIYFYYDDNGVKTEFVYGSSSITGTIEAHSSANVVFYWEWVYDYDEYLQKQGEDPFRDAALEIGSAYSDDYEKLGLNYYSIYPVVCIIDSVKEDKESVLESVYNKYINTDSPSFSDTEIAILSRLLEIANDYYVWDKDDEVNYLAGMASMSATEVEALEDSTFKYACKLASGYGTAEDQYSAIIENNVLGFPQGELSDIAFYLYGTDSGTGIHYMGAGGQSKAIDLIGRASAIFGETKITASGTGNTAVFNALFELGTLDRTTVKNTFNHYDEYKQKTYAFHDKYYTAVGSAASNITFSEVMTEAFEAWSSAINGGDASGYVTQISETDFTTPETYLESYRNYYKPQMTLLGMAESFAADRDDFDEYDTKIGSDPSYYKQFMNAKVYIIGEQIEPTEVTR